MPHVQQSYIGGQSVARQGVNRVIEASEARANEIFRPIDAEGAEMSGFEPDHQAGQRPVVPGRSKFIAAVILGVGFVVGAAALSFPWLDSLDQRWTTCEVVQAAPFRGDNTSTQPWKVQIRTTDCQDVILSDGVTEDNVERIASSIEPGEYDFKMSWVSRRLADGWWPTIAPSIKEFRSVE